VLQRLLFCSCQAYNPASMDDQQLVQQCLQRRPQAQRLFYERFAGPMLGVCFRYTKSMADAEDVLQEGFIKAFNNLHQYKASGELGGWLRRIMVTTALNYLKKNVRYRSELSFDAEQLHPVSSEDPVVLLQAKELAELVRQLPVGYQTIFNLHAIEGYTHVEIGAILGIHEGTSRSQYARARALLITWIQKMPSSKTDVYARTGI
jgi:RNA polymerase sigma factor (sigma-70 family)